HVLEGALGEHGRSARLPPGKLNLNVGACGSAPVGARLARDCCPAPRVMADRGLGGNRGQGPLPLSVGLAPQEGRDVQVAAVVAEARGGRGGLGGGAAAGGAAAAAQGGGDALAGAERLGDLVDQHAGGAVALALVVDQLDLRAALLAAVVAE